MTDEKKKPDEDEVTDEQLEEVAGGVLPGSINPTLTEPEKTIQPPPTSPTSPWTWLPQNPPPDGPNSIVENMK